MDIENELKAMKKKEKPKNKKIPEKFKLLFMKKIRSLQAITSTKNLNNFLQKIE